MKKLFVCAMAAMVALASCTKTEMVETSAPQEIGFKAVTGKMTKGSQTTVTFDQTLGVFAYVNDERSPRKYFTNANFKKTQNTVSVTDPTDENNTISLITWEDITTPRYWPIESSLDFIVYSPHVDAASVTDNVLSVIVADNSTNQYDFMYGSEYYDGYKKSDTYVPVNLEHALALITVNFTKGTGVKEITTATLDNTIQSGTYTYDYNANAQSPFSWTSKGSGNYCLDLLGNNDTWMVVPSNSTTITITYKLDGMDENVSLNYTIENLGSEWVAGTHYIYNVSITPDAIKFVPTVTPWVSTTAEEKEVY